MRGADMRKINSPEWNRTEAEITGPGKAYNLETSWTFGLL